ncbi:MAG: nucleotidyltransferase domain-containing protein [Syntrophales bacterium]|nr:nucleotidyltransferase domain-containing protein [Syntrophales bacterium]
MKVSNQSRTIRSYKKNYNKLLNKINQLFVNYYKDRLVSLVVFGSVASGNFSPQSDIDLLIVLTTKKGNYEDFSEYYENIESKLDRINFSIRINPIFKTEEELNVRTPFLWDTEFLILYDKKHVFMRFLDSLKTFKKTHLRFHNKKLKYIEIIN